MSIVVEFNKGEPAGMVNYSEKVAIVTGAGSGIGRSVAVGLLRSGYAVVLAGRRLELLDSAAVDADPERVRSLAVATDVTQPSSVHNLFKHTQDRFGRLDLLFNNAGTSTLAAPLEELAFDAWKTVLDVNLTGAFLCTQQAFRIMKTQVPQGGRIINNGSISAHSPRPNSVAYTATKHAITGLTRSTSLDGRKYNIACGQIDIGNAATDMTQSMATGMPQADGRMEIEPRMDVHRVTESVLFMAGLPLDANVLFMTVMATKMPFVGRG